MDAPIAKARKIAPLQAGQAITKNWRTINEIGAATGVMDAARVQAAREQADQTEKRKIGYGHFPFRIYHMPDALRGSPDSATDWRRFTVRAGKVFVNWVEITPTGTDLETFPDCDSFPGVGEILADSGAAKYWFWLELTTSTAVVNSGASPPTWSAYYIPIGYVDTTDTTNSYARVRQLIRTDVFTCI